jgi:hypothetical protein
MLARWVILLCLLWIGSVFAQPDTLWTRTYGGTEAERCYGMQQTRDGGYILAGFTRSFGAGSFDYWLMKTDVNGDSVWSRTYGGPEFESCSSVQQTTDGGYILAGYRGMNAEGVHHFWLVKTDSTGDSLWSRTYGGSDYDECYDSFQSSDGGYILTGITTSFGAGLADFWMVKTDANGDSLWSHTYGGLADDICTSAHQTTDGGYILAGYTASYGSGGTDFWMVKTDANGDSLWSRTYGMEGSQECRSVEQTLDGGYLLAGTDFNSGPYFWLVKTDSNGDSLWTRTISSIWGACYSVQQTADHGYILGGGRMTGIPEDLRFIVAKADSDGNLAWNRIFHAGSYAKCWTARQTTDGGYIFGGYTSVNGFDFWLIRMAPELAAEPQPTLEPAQFTLLPNYPNPFNASTRIAFSLPKTGYVDLNVYDVTGRLVRSLAGGHMSPPLQAGEHQIEFDGSGLASGIYFTRLQVGEMSQTRKMVLLK